MQSSSPVYVVSEPAVTNVSILFSLNIHCGIFKWLRLKEHILESPSLIYVGLVCTDHFAGQQFLWVRNLSVSDRMNRTLQML